jgi:hypothetical protein
MHRFWILAASLLLATSSPSQSVPAAAIVLPAGTQIDLILTRPLWTATATPDEALYTQTLTPVSIGNQIAVPAGTYVHATLKAVIRPTAATHQALLQIQFEQLIFANGYVVTLSGPGQAAQFTYLTISAATDNDLLLDNGAQFTFSLQQPFTLNAEQVAAALPLSQVPDPSAFAPATRCRNIPGSPGSDATPDTVIAGSPGTPDTIIPGMNGAPDTVIPGIPATQPQTLFGTGSPATPATAPYFCPAPPQVLSSSTINPLNQLPLPSAPPSHKHHSKKS